MLITRHAEAIAALADPDLVPPPVAQEAPTHTLAWLRANVCRFSAGETHVRRRKAVEDTLAGVDPADLRRLATVRTDLAADDVATVVLGQALGIERPERLIPHVETAAAGYLSGENVRGADAAIAALMAEADIAVVTLLLQAQHATSSLISKAIDRDDGSAAVDQLLHETLRFAPPVPRLRRVGVEIDVAAANRDHDDSGRMPQPYLTFGYGMRRCPASAHAMAIAAGYVEGVRRGIR